MKGYWAILCLDPFIRGIWINMNGAKEVSLTTLTTDNALICYVQMLEETMIISPPEIKWT